MLDVSSFNNALNSLAEALSEYTKNSGNLFVRDACIQRFEYSYELAFKMLKRALERISSAPSTVDGLSFPDIIRTGSEAGLLEAGWPAWRVFREARNITSHTYDAAKAAQVCAVIPDFLKEAQYLLAALRKNH